MILPVPLMTAAFQAQENEHGQHKSIRIQGERVPFGHVTCTLLDVLLMSRPLFTDLHLLQVLSQPCLLPSQLLLLGFITKFA